MSFGSAFTHGFMHGILDNMFFGGFNRFCFMPMNWGCGCGFGGGFWQYPNMSLFSTPPIYTTPMPKLDATSAWDWVNTQQPQETEFDKFIRNMPKVKIDEEPGKEPEVEVEHDEKPKAKHWSEMTDDELKATYGNYTRKLTDKNNNITAEKLDKYLKGKGVLEGKGKVFMEAQQKYGIGAAVLVGICMNESAKGTSNLAKTKNNVGGVRSGSEWKQYSSVDECIMDMARFLNSGYVKNSKPLTTLYQVNGQYCPVAEVDSNSGWAKNVEFYAKEVDKACATA